MNRTAIVRFFGASLACVALAGAAQAAERSETSDCYDAAFVGNIQDEANEVALEDLVPHDKGTLMMGFRADLLVRVRNVLQGSDLPDFIWTRTVLTDMFTPKVPILFFVRRAKQHPYDTVSIYVPPSHDGRFRAPERITPEILKSADISGAVCGAQ